MRRLSTVLMPAALPLLAFMSCQSSRTATASRPDNFTYFQTTPAADSLAATSPSYTFRLETGDVVGITVSSQSKEADALYNPFSNSSQQLNGTNTQTNNTPPGYVVGTDGTLNFPKLGLVPVKGRTTSEVEQQLASLLKTQLLDPFVAVRLLNFKVSVLGEVARPSVFTVQNERITLPEALALAGDLTPFGRRDNVLVVREVAGKQAFAHVDLRDRSLFKSPFYYLKPNDMVYVAARRARKLQAGSLFPWVPTLISGASLLVLLYTNLIR